MIINNKYFVPPAPSDENFKVLFARLAASGAGRPVDETGAPDGPWTPELLTNAISAFEKNPQGIDRRAVQVWFQKNDRGISDQNIRWLARIFGCDDPDATSRWQTKLRDSKDRLAEDRRRKKQVSSPIDDQPDPEKPLSGVGDEKLPAEVTESGVQGAGNLAIRTEAMFADSNILKMPIILWCGLAVLWLVAIGLGNHSITYTLSTGTEKQVGFIWAIGWNIGDPIFMPIFLVLTSRLVSEWRQVDRAALAETDHISSLKAWLSRVKGFTVTFWVILLSCVLGVFFIQWVGIYLIPLRSASANLTMIDWWLIALVDPAALSVVNAIWSSFLGYAYSGLIYWFLFAGMLMQYVVSSDFSDICSSWSEKQQKRMRGASVAKGRKIIESVYKGTIAGIMLALTIKLNGAYLVTDAGSITAWLLQDVAAATGLAPEQWSWIQDSPPPFFTSFVLLFLHLVVFAICAFLVDSGIEKTRSQNDVGRPLRSMVLKMSSVLLLLSAGYLTIGLFTGFTILLGLTLSIAIGSLFHNFSRPHPTSP